MEKSTSKSAEPTKLNADNMRWSEPRKRTDLLMEVHGDSSELTRFVCNCAQNVPTTPADTRRQSQTPQIDFPS